MIRLLYCVAFSSWQEAEQKYATHFDAEWKKRNCKGYEIMKELHDSSSEPEFCAARKIFDSTFYDNSASACNALQNTLQKKEALLNITFTAGPNYHSVTAFADPSGLLTKDTMKQGLQNLTALANLGVLRDALLHVRK